MRGSGHRLQPHLMKGREMASTVRMNQDGWTMIKDFRFFRNLRGKAEAARWAPGTGPGEGGRGCLLHPPWAHHHVTGRRQSL